MEYCKRLIEVDLPIKRISEHARREKSIRHGHISTLHIWWARRPLAACRAVICASLWPDPADHLCPDEFKKNARHLMMKWAEKHLKLLTSKESINRFIQIQKNPDKLNSNLFLRQTLFDFIADFANWDNSTVVEYLETSRALTQCAHESLGGVSGTRPLVVDPFAGGGAIPLEALRIGADTFASELNDVPFFINKTMLECMAEGSPTLQDEYVHWAKVLNDRVRNKLQPFFPCAQKTEEPFAYFWARTITCEGPSCGRLIPLIGSPHLTKKQGRKNSIAIEYPKNSQVPHVLLCDMKDRRVKNLVRGGATICECGYTTPVTSVRLQLNKSNGGTDESMLLAVGVLNRNGQKEYRLPVKEDLNAIKVAKAEKARLLKNSKSKSAPFPQEKIWGKSKMNIGLYGMETWDQVFSSRQILQLKTYQEELFELINEEKGIPNTIIYLLIITIDKLVDYSTTLCRWVPGGEFIAATLGGEKKLPMMWDYVESVLYGKGPGSWHNMSDWVSRVIKHFIDSKLLKGTAVQADARVASLPSDSAQAIITDPPYYDAIWYSDLGDLFSVWLKRALKFINFQIELDILKLKEKEIIKSTFSEKDGLTPKDDNFYEQGMKDAFIAMRDVLQPSGIAVIVFAHKSTSGWETILNALLCAGWTVTNSWPIDTEREARMTSIGQASLSSSIHLVCRPRENPDGSVRVNDIGDWRDVLAELPKRIHEWMPRLAEEGVVGADAIFACLGPALEIFSRYSRVEKASGEQVTLKEYLEQVWAVVAKEALNMIFEGADTAGFEEDARLTAMWLWTLSTDAANGEASASDAEEDEADEEKAPKAKLSGYTLEYDAARKIAQGLGAHLEGLKTLVEVKGDTARLLSVSERTKALFGKEDSESPAVSRRKKSSQLELGFMEELEKFEQEGSWGQKNVPQLGNTRLDRLHQSMILFAAGRGEALKRFLVEEGVGRDQRFWRLAQALSALYPSISDEKRWVDGVLARKKGLGF